MMRFFRLFLPTFPNYQIDNSKPTERKKHNGKYPISKQKAKNS
jgi:hypothetical protein